MNIISTLFVLLLHKIGGASGKKFEQALFFPLACTIFAKDN